MAERPSRGQWETLAPLHHAWDCIFRPHMKRGWLRSRAVCPPDSGLLPVHWLRTVPSPALALPWLWSSARPPTVSTVRAAQLLSSTFLSSLGAPKPSGSFQEAVPQAHHRQACA